MPKVSFRIVPHSVRAGRELVEILFDDEVVGAIYPADSRPGIKIVSVHITDQEISPELAAEVIHDDGTDKFPHIPSLELTFKPSPWYLTPDGRVVKISN
jgi:hypothetical protein